MFPQAHNDLNPLHQRLGIKEYLKSPFSKEIRYCQKHKEQPLCLGCDGCMSIICAKCVTSMGVCGNGKYHVVNNTKIAQALQPLILVSSSDVVL